MTDTSIQHGTFTVEHHYAAPPARVFRAWSDPGELRQWAAPAEDWAFDILSFDFRVGGGDLQAFGPRGEVPYTVTSRYDAIIPGQRLVAAYAVHRGEVRISSSVLSLELEPEGDGTLLRITEQGAFFDGLETPEIRKGGVTFQLGQLESFLDRRQAA